MLKEYWTHITTWLELPWLRKILWIALAILIVWTLGFIVKKSLDKYVQDNLGRYRSKKLVNFVAFAILGIAIAIILSENLGGLGVTIGVAGAGIAFALQEVIVSFAGWIAILTGNFFKTGDRLELGGVKGDVIDIGVLRTTIMETGKWVDGDLYNGRMVRVANSFIFKEPVTNYTSDFPFLWDEIKIPVKYGSDLKLARTLLQEVADEILKEYSIRAAEAWKDVVQKYLIEDAVVMPMITLLANDNWAEFTLRFVVDFKRRRSTKDQLWTSILDKIDATEGKVGLASATFHLVEAPPFRVEVSGNLPTDPKS